MSSEEETSELKAGHPPAVKVGGMRVANKPSKPHNDGGAGDEEEKEKAAIQPSANSFLSTQPNTDMGEVVTKGHLSQQHGEHVKQFHEPRVPTHEKRPPNPQVNMHINQPR